MQNNEIDNLQEILALARLSAKNYFVAIAVSPYLYNYISNSIKNIDVQDNYINKINYFCGCQIFIDKTLKNYEYKIVRKEI